MLAVIDRLRRRCAARAIAAAAVALAFGILCAPAGATSEPEPPSPSSLPTRGLVAEAVAYEHGEGVAKDPLKAASLYCEAARAGDIDATFNLGWMYANGRGIGRNEAYAGTLFARAARGGHAQAQRLVEFVGGDRGTLPDCMIEPSTAGIDIAAADAGWGIPPDFVLDPFAQLPRNKQKIADVVNRVAPRYSIDPRLALAVIAAESNFEPRARSEKGAIGLMQLIPETAARFNVKKPYDITDNVRGGLQYLRWLLAYYEGEVTLAVAAYNAGEGAVDRYRGVPPYPETRDYVKRVMGLFQRQRHPYDARLPERSPIVTATAPAHAQ